MGTERSLVPTTEKVNPGAFVKVKAILPPLVNATPPKFDRMGAGMLNAVESAAVRLPEVKCNVAPVTALVLKADKPTKVATPKTAVCVLVPPNVQVACPAAFVMLAVLLVTTMPNESATLTTGCVTKVPPSAAGDDGCVVITSFDAVPIVRACTIELVL